VHIGFVTPESPTDPSRGGGIAAYLRAIIPGLIGAGHRVTVIANAREAGVEQSCGGALKVVHVRLPSLHWYLARLPWCARTIVLPLRQIEWSSTFHRAARRVFRYDPPDVLESTDLGSLWLTSGAGTPLVIRLHGSDYIFRKHTGEALHMSSRWNHRFEQRVWRRARALTSPSAFQAAVVAHDLGWAGDRIQVIPNPIAPAMLAEALRRPATAGDDTAAPVILYTGRLAPVKGTLPLLDAVGEVRKTLRDARFVLAGPWQMPDKPERWGLQPANAESQGLLWLGHVPWQKLADWYRAAAVFVMPSYYETFGIACLEAMAFGLPIVATTAGGLPEVVEDGVTGLLVPPGDAHALAAAILRLLHDADLRQRLGQAGRARVLREFTVDCVVERTVAVYRDVAAKA
jgi:glycosyltransferase involved in cell wall biosynthesis